MYISGKRRTKAKITPLTNNASQSTYTRLTDTHKISGAHETTHQI